MPIISQDTAKEAIPVVAAWSGSTTYNIDDLVYYNSQYWKSKVNSNQNHIPTANEVQVISVPSGTTGTFTLTYDGQTTSTLTYRTGSSEHYNYLSASTIQTALRALSNIGDADVTVTGSGGSGTSTYTVTFQGAFVGVDVPQIVVNNLTTNHTITVSTSTSPSYWFGSSYDDVYKTLGPFWNASTKTLTTQSISVKNADAVRGAVYSNQAGKVYIDQSSNNIDWDVTNYSAGADISVSASTGKGFKEDLLLNHVRLRYTYSGSTVPTTFRLLAKTVNY